MTRAHTALRKRPVLATVAFTVWVFVGFMLAQALTIGLLYTLPLFGVSFVSMNESVYGLVVSAFIYVLTIAIIIGVPGLVGWVRTTWHEIGLHRLPSWLDLLWAPAGYIVYALLAVVALWLAGGYLPFVDVNQEQEVGFENISRQFEYILAFVSLVVVAPIAEEVIFRGYLLGKLRERAPLWVAILVTSILFGFVHFAWNVGIDVFVLSVVLCVLRVLSGSLWAPILLHMTKNAVAFYFIFVAPQLW